MVYGFVKQSGGHVKIYSEVGTARRSRLYLPRAAAERRVTRRRRRGAAPPRGRETVLVVEDNAEVRASSSRQLRELGYRVLEADGAGGAAPARRAEPIDLLFTDVVHAGRLEDNGVRYSRSRLPVSMRACISSTVSASFAWATSISAKGGNVLVSGHASGCHRPERIMHFGQWDSTRAISMMRMCSGSLPLTAIGFASSASRTMIALPAMRRVWVTRGSRKSARHSGFQDVPKRIEPAITQPVRDRNGPLVQNLDEAGGIAFRRESIVPSSPADATKTNGA